MSWSLSVLANGFIIGLLRTPDLNSRSCSAMYTALWPASRGQSGLVLLPFGPWHAIHTAALVAPSASLPWANGASGGAAGVAAVASVAAAAASAVACGEAAVLAGGVLGGDCALANTGAQHRRAAS